MSGAGRYEAVIGLEVHAQMLTESKIFCGCSTRFGAEPNTQTCPVCCGLPGVLPVLNRKAVEFAIRTGMALGSTIAPFSVFARKNYFYPDLPKGYQISQYELPLCVGGHLDIRADFGERRIGITRIHLEEDAGKNIHESGAFSCVDLNRTGVPLMEIVSEPDLRTPAEAADYMRKLRSILLYIGVCDGSMEQGSLRCDANVSVRIAGEIRLGVKTELKNMNSFRFVEKAIEYEIRRQTGVLDGGGKIIQETRLWNTETGVTEPMRSKEEAHDYRYFPDPDLIPVVADEAMIESIRPMIPELPGAKTKRYVSEFGISESDSEFITAERPFAEWFEEAIREGGPPKAVANWMRGEFTRLLNEQSVSLSECSLKPEHLVSLIKLTGNGHISGNAAKAVFEDMFVSGREPEVIVREKGLAQISDDSALESTVDEVIASCPKETERFRQGDEKLLGFFVGQAMKKTKGKGNPQKLNELFRRKLSVA